MSTTSFYERSLAGAAAEPVRSFRARMESQVSGERQPTDFGWWVLKQMADRNPPMSQADLARRVRVSQSTVSRWIYDPIRPDTDKLAQLADALDLDRGEVLTRAGHGRPATVTEGASTDPRLAKLAILLGHNSPIPESELAVLRSVVDGVIAPYEKYLAAGIRRTG